MPRKRPPSESSLTSDDVRVLIAMNNADLDAAADRGPAWEEWAVAFALRRESLARLLNRKIKGGQ